MDLNETAAVKITGKIMVISILILFMVLLFVLLLLLYAKWFYSSVTEELAPPPPQTRRRRRHLVFYPGSQDVAATRQGLDPSILRSLPVLVFHPEDFNDGLECTVCLSELVQGEKARLLPKCNHGFHVDCIDMWFLCHSTCPLCRNPINPEFYNPCESVIDIESQAEVSTESLFFPTNVLFWGNESEVSSMSACSEEASGPSTSSTSIDFPEGILPLDVQNEISSPSSSLASRLADEGEKSSLVATRLRSLKRLLSRERKATSTCSSSHSSSVDVEQEGREQN